MKLTKRQQQVLSLVCEGYTNPQISDHLGIKLVTVKKHMTNLLQLFRADNRLQLAIKFLKWKYAIED